MNASKQVRGLVAAALALSALAPALVAAVPPAPSGSKPKVAAPVAGQLPTAKLTCAYQDRKLSAKWGEPTQYSLHFSNMASLTLRGGRYYSATSSSGAFERIGGDKIRLTTGTWAGAIGSLEPDGAGRPAVVFHIEENRRADGSKVVDPDTTRCTESPA